MVTAMKKILLITIFLFIIIQISFAYQIRAYTDERVNVQLYFTWMEEDGNWHEWIRVSDENGSILYEDLTLKIGQPLKCRIKIVPYDTCIVAFKIIEPGVTRCYDVLEGLKHDEGISYYVFEPGTETEYLKKHPNTLVSYPNLSIEHTWVLQTNEDGVGWAGVPLNCFWDVEGLYTYDDYDVDDEVSFTYAKILNEQWTGPNYNPDNGNDNNGNTNDNGNSNNGTPGFELLVVLVALGIILCFKKKRSI
jgi:hypothetical protein